MAAVKTIVIYLCLKAITTLITHGKSGATQSFAPLDFESEWHTCHCKSRSISFSRKEEKISAYVKLLQELSLVMDGKSRIRTSTSKLQLTNFWKWQTHISITLATWKALLQLRQSCCSTCLTFPPCPSLCNCLELEGPTLALVRSQGHVLIEFSQAV